MTPLLSYLYATHWAIEPAVFDQMHTLLLRHAEGVRLSASEIEAAIGRAPTAANPMDRQYQVKDGIALIPIRGVLAKHADQVGGTCQPQGTSFETIQANLRTAEADPAVKHIALHIESPGGAVDGTMATGDLIRALSKPSTAFIDGLGASAAYWLASQADQIVATPSAIVGSIGVITSLASSKAAAEKAGMRVHVVRSGPLKAPGQMGEDLTDAQIASAQQTVNDLFGQFVNAVSTGRSLTGEALATVTDGRTWVATQAKNLGLVDRLQQWDAFLADLSASLTTSSSTPTTRPQAAPSKGNRMDMKAMKSLLATYPNAGQVLANLADDTTHEAAEAAIIRDSLATANTKIGALTKDLDAKEAIIAAKDAEIDALKAVAAPAGLKPLDGVDPKALAAAGDPLAAYNALGEELKAKGVRNWRKEIAAKHPAVHQAFLAAAQKKG